MTEPKEDPPARPEGKITFCDREIRVAMPSPEQIMVWQRTLERLQNADISDWSGRDVLAALERTRKIIDSILMDEADKDWLDDEMLAGRIGLKESADIVVKAQATFMNRDQRRASAKKTASPAKRKKAAS